MVKVIAILFIATLFSGCGKDTNTSNKNVYYETQKKALDKATKQAKSLNLKNIERDKILDEM